MVRNSNIIPGPGLGGQVTCVLRYDGDRAIFDTFLLSCRALGRGVEEIFLSHALRLASKRGVAIAVGEYIATRKNTQVENFYVKQGFTELPSEEEPAVRRFALQLDRPLKADPDYYIEIIIKLDT